MTSKEKNMTDTTSSSTDPNEEPQTPAPTGEQPKGGNSEAAKYRTQLRAAEAERDTVSGRLETAHRTMVEGIASKSLAKPEALWKAGVQLADLLDDDGNVDPEKVNAAVLTAKEELGLERPAYGPIVPGQGDTPNPIKTSESFANAFSPR